VASTHAPNRTSTTAVSEQLAARLRSSEATPLQSLCARVSRTVSHASGEPHREVAAAIAPFLGISALLQDVSCRCSSDRYMRHLLDAGPTYCVLALIWRPGQMSPVHGHRTWCAFGMHRGWMAETFFTRCEQGVAPRECIQRRVGEIAYTGADPDDIHRLANLGTETAISIHVYGASFDRLGAEVNHVWAD
jgi:predicted metal-dependent enzyme (double-stranded beta helix superfamily)